MIYYAVGTPLALEVIAIVILLFSRRLDYAPSRFYEAENTLIGELERAGSPWHSTVVPHPHLSHFHIPGKASFSKTDPDPKNYVSPFNSLGFFGDEIPEIQSDRYFDILMVGGSVANFMSQSIRSASRYLEAALNARYRSPDGRPFRVLNGALGGWSQPNSVIMAALYGRHVSAIVSLEGFNELWRLSGDVRHRLESPSIGYRQLISAVLISPWLVIYQRFVNGLKRILSRTPILSRSALLFLCYRGLRWGLNRLAARRHVRNELFRQAFRLRGPEDAPARLEWNIGQYRHFVRMFDAMGSRLGIPHAVFLQPHPGVHKTLTPEERANARPEMGERYEYVVSRLMELRGEGVDIFSLLDLYQDCSEHIYADMIHAVVDPETGASRGYEMMANRMADDLAAAWQLKGRQTEADAQVSDAAVRAGDGPAQPAQKR